MLTDQKPSSINPRWKPTSTGKKPKYKPSDIEKNFLKDLEKRGVLSPTPPAKKPECKHNAIAKGNGEKEYTCVSCGEPVLDPKPKEPSCLGCNTLPKDNPFHTCKKPSCALEEEIKARKEAGEVPFDTEKCCDKCYTTYNDHGYPYNKTLDACYNPDCECHTQEPNCEMCKVVDELAPSLSYCPKHDYSNPPQESKGWDLENLLRGLVIKGYDMGKAQKKTPYKYTCDTDLTEEVWKAIQAEISKAKEEATFQLTKLEKMTYFNEGKKEERREWNCQCEKPKPDGYVCIGEAEGNYQRCLNCDRRIWK